MVLEYAKILGMAILIPLFCGVLAAAFRVVSL